MTEASGDGGFLARWSRLKRAGQAPPAPVPLDVAPAAEAPAFDPSTLPPVETLTIDSDLTAFLRPGVPSSLRSAALRRLWTLDPAIRDYIGPADYAWDWNVPDGVPGFSPTLVGDIRALVAQAVGQAPPEDPAPAVALGAEGGNPVTAPLLAETQPIEPAATTDREPLAAVVDDARPPRHGSALPT